MFVAFPPDVWYLIAAKMPLRHVMHVFRTCVWLFKLHNDYAFWSVRAYYNLPGGNDDVKYNFIRLHGNPAGDNVPLPPALAYRAAAVWHKFPFKVCAYMTDNLPKKLRNIVMQTLPASRLVTHPESPHQMAIDVDDISESIVTENGEWILTATLHLPSDEFRVDGCDIWLISQNKRYTCISPVFLTDVITNDDELTFFELDSGSWLSRDARITSVRRVIDVALLRLLELEHVFETDFSVYVGRVSDAYIA